MYSVLDCIFDDRKVDEEADCLNSLIEQERIKEAKKSLSVIAQYLSPQEIKIIQAISKGVKNVHIAKEIGRAENAVRSKVKHIPIKLQKLSEKHSELKNALSVLKDCLTPNGTIHFGHTTHDGKFLFERYMKVSVGTYKAHRNDGNYYVTKTKCMIPEYLQATNCIACCPLCPNCKRQKK